MKALLVVSFIVSSLFLSASVQAGNFESKIRTSTNSSGTVTVRTISEGDEGRSQTVTKKYKNGSTSTETTTNGKKVASDGSNGGDHSESGARDAGATEEEASEVAKRHKFCLDNPEDESCNDTGASSGQGTEYYDPNSDGEERDPFILN